MGTKIKLPKINKKNFPYKLVICYWEDIVSESSWADIIDIKKAKTAVCCSVGWLVKNDDKVTIVMADYSFEDNKEIKQGGSYTTIPTKNDPGRRMSGSLIAGRKKYKFSDTLENGRNGTYRVGIGSGRVGMG